MKHLLTILFALIAFWHAGFARDGNRSALKVQLADGQLLTVVIDGRDYQRYGRTITIGDLPAGRHSIKVYEFYAYRDREGGRAKLVYEGKVKTYDNTVTDCIVDKRRGTMRVLQYDMSRYSNSKNSDSKKTDETAGREDNAINGNTDSETSTVEHVKEISVKDNLDRYYGRDYNILSDNNRSTSSGTRTTTATRSSTYEGSSLRGSGNLWRSDMDRTEKLVKVYASDTERLQMMKEQLENHTYTTAQAAEMMRWLSFESTRVEFLKWAYDSVTDNEKYSELLDDFYFSNYEEDLKEFIEEQQ